MYVYVNMFIVTISNSLVSSFGTSELILAS